MPRVARLNIAPVRSLGLETRDEIMLGPLGVAEDRRFFIIDEGGRLVDQLIAGEMVRVRAWTDPGATMLRLTFPDGTVCEDVVRLGGPVEAPVHGRVALGHIVEGPLGESLGAFLGRQVRIVRCDRIGGTRRAHPATLVTDGSLEAIGSVLGVGDVDARRFRMLIELDGGEPHEEDTWLGGRVGLGETVLRISGQVARCAITTHDPDTGQRDHDTLHAIKRYRGQINGKDLMFGVWGEVETPGRIRLGDEIRLLA
ncbi:MAG TPA: MOSC N-terminal beta barrel domain-containing protein [Candidatus Limnocylindrales bacterium]|jgi:uncharacterized protein YcbX|nr:MOSC N-terminal beta barrel domain-containing protein [Candidatus Limnocylindrales bacterium]